MAQLSFGGGREPLILSPELPLSHGHELEDVVDAGGCIEFPLIGLIFTAPVTFDFCCGFM